ncbi:uncharacterized protein LOC123507871 [Portunus trituberculatus]|uniref:Putative G-protein coupled receptor Mth-like 3 n=1 Tax=Portunus trituberculatus TaxID=210409 RepID=A0A5B7DJL2_PORTR|nr:uncharacterized protein LOC123507871 [Portunus trituberculatus]XP_045117068.1 uncharacterized protein LOC123507871 [Portunus trituberculatus]XP_045117069.1 uncharacterized protein LOC123507871 [Portunus trituberculatus]MPC21600.1 putative G-protein coupled receptor Mth-like 3 [Portunus trituberculatus]
MFGRMASPRVMRWGVAMLFVMSVLIQEVTSDLASILILRKCSCNKYQAWNGETCVDSNNTFVPVYNKTALDPVKGEVDLVKFGFGILSSTVQNVTIMPLEARDCPEGHFPSLLKENIMLLPDGRLLWLSTMSIFTIDVFCNEFFWMNDQDVYFEVFACLPPPAVPHCCPANHLLHQNGSCYPYQALHPPPLQMGTDLVDWDDVESDPVSLRCGQHEFLHQIKLGIGTTDGWLMDTQPIAALEWSPNFWVAFSPWRNYFCVAPQQTETGELQYVAQICFKDHDRYYKHHCNASACVRKCCHEDQVLVGNICQWVDDPNLLWRPEQIPGQEINEQWKLVAGEPGCAFYFHEGDIHLLPNGSLYFNSKTVPPSMYCVDNRIGATGEPVKLAMICFPPKEYTCFWRDILIKVVVGLSFVFSLATLVVYLSVAELRDHTYGRCLISMVAAMLTAYILLLCGPESAHTMAGCYAMAYGKHLTVLAVFFWLNVMCFDMWKILRGSTVQHHSRRVFLCYSVYAWGCPLVVSTITLVLDLVAPENIILPAYFNGACWFNDDQAYWAYFSSFILIIVVINIGFFIHVAVTLYQKMKQSTKNFETNLSRKNKTTKAKHQMWLFTKLFVVMGVMWITDIFSTVMHRRTCTYWVFTDVINGLQGVFIFIVAVCNKDNLKKIKDAWQPRVQVIRKTFSSKQGQSSQRTQQSLSIDDTEASRKTSITSLPRKISQASNIFFPSSAKKSANLNPADSSEHAQGGRKGSNVSIKDVIPLSSMQE